MPLRRAPTALIAPMFSMSMPLFVSNVLPGKTPNGPGGIRTPDLFSALKRDPKALQAPEFR